MFVIDLTLKGTPIALSVQRKDEETVQALYQEITQAMKADQPQLLELTCDQQPGKKIAILSSEISAIQMTDKASASTTGRTPGFWAELAR